MRSFRRIRPRRPIDVKHACRALLRVKALEDRCLLSSSALAGVGDFGPLRTAPTAHESSSTLVWFLPEEGPAPPPRRFARGSRGPGPPGGPFDHPFESLSL